MYSKQSNLLKLFGENKENFERNDGDADDLKSSKRLSVERIYQKKTQLEHILLRPDSYIGSVEPATQTMWIYDGPENGMVHRDVTIVPGLYKIFDEILVNAADNKQRDKKMDCIKVEIDPDRNRISIWNNGKGIPVVEHKVEKTFVPSLIFGHLLTSSNYNDEEMKVTGGRNGYGAKLCNIFSTKFTVETFSNEDGKLFKQTWTDNMTKTTAACVKPHKGTEFTCVTFYPDLTKFSMEALDKDIVALMSRRVFDVAGSTRGVKVFLNGVKLPVKGFKDYIDQYTKNKQDEQGNPLKVIYENVNERWEVGVTVSDGGFQQLSFVNSIATTKGGRHVDYVTEQIVSKLIEAVKKKNKRDVKVKPCHIKTHIWVFVNCLIVNPTFDSQTKENMTLQASKFGSKCQLSDKFFTQVLKCGIMESVLSWVCFKAQIQLDQKCSSRKRSKIQGVPKLEDANNAGTQKSVECTLILTEGDSAKTLAVSGLSVVGRDKYGVFPLRGKMLNVREATHKQILENQEINNIIKIMGLQYKKKYESMDDLKTLRYGRIMIMTDQDQDGSHIKGLLINFIHYNWPSLLRLPFLEEFITPIVKIFKGKEDKSFYSLPEYEEWKQETPNWNTWKIKYYKGLGTSTSKEAKEYFHDMRRHRIKFQYNDTEDDTAIQLAFSKKMVDERKEWLTSGMEERRRRRELGLSELYLYGKQTTVVTYNDFVNKELILFSNMDNERSIPSLVDGLKPGQRKVMYTCFKRNDKREIKVAQLAGSVAEHSAYHHGEVSLMSTIINLAQNFVGSNNINLLQPIGQFGTRLQGGKDAASPRYIFTMLSTLARKLFPQVDDALLTHLYDDNQCIEPEYYIPIIPTVLVNGAEGIGTGWSTKIPNYNPRDIVENIRRLLRGEDVLVMNPWFKNFQGIIERLHDQHFVINGEIAILGPSKLEITELPVRVWTQTYKEQVLEAMLHGSEKLPPLITDYKEYHTDTTVRFVITMNEDKLSKLKEAGLHKAFKLQTTLSTSSMVLFDHNGCIQKYASPEDILKEFYTVRLNCYEQRKVYLEGMLTAEANRLDSQARFILEKIEGKIVIENRKKSDLIKTLQERGYESDPVKVWKRSQSKEEVEESKDENASDGLLPDYDYLLGMSLWSLTKEKKDELLKKRDEKFMELEKLKQKTPSNLWEEDLEVFVHELDEVEKKEYNETAMFSGKTLKPGKKNKVLSSNVMPSPRGERIIPVVEPELKKRYEKTDSEGKKKRTRKVANEKTDGEGKKKWTRKVATAAANQENIDSEVNALKPLNERMEKKIQAKSGLKQMTLSFNTAQDDPVTTTEEQLKNSPISDSSDYDIENKHSQRKKQKIDSSESFIISSDDSSTDTPTKKTHKMLKERNTNSKPAAMIMKGKNTIARDQSSEMKKERLTLQKTKQAKNKDSNAGKKDKGKVSLKMKHSVFDAFFTDRKNTVTTSCDTVNSNANTLTMQKCGGTLNADTKKSQTVDSDSSIEDIFKRAATKKVRKAPSSDSDADSELEEVKPQITKRTKKLREDSDPDFTVEKIEKKIEINKCNLKPTQKNRQTKKRILKILEDSDSSIE